MLPQSVVVIQDASNDINSRVFHWAIQGLSLKPGDKLTLVVVLHQVITPLGYKLSVDSRSAFGASQKTTEAQAATKKEEYLKNEKLVEIYKLYKSMKVGFYIELAMGSSPKAVALKSASKLKATWVILDRKMKKDEDYFLQKLSCGISRIRNYNRIVRLRGPLDHPQHTRRSSSSEIYAESIPLQDTSTEMNLFSIDISPNSHTKNDQMNREPGQRNPLGEAGCSTHDSNETGEISPCQLSNDKNDNYSKQLLCLIERDQRKESRHHGEERDRKLKQKLEECNSDITCGGSSRKKHSLSTEVYQKSERYLFPGGARNFYLGEAEEYTVCEQFFNLSNFHLRN